MSVKAGCRGTAMGSAVTELRWLPPAVRLRKSVPALAPAFDVSMVASVLSVERSAGKLTAICEVPNGTNYYVAGETTPAATGRWQHGSRGYDRQDAWKAFRAPGTPLRCQGTHRLCVRAGWLVSSV